MSKTSKYILVIILLGFFVCLNSLGNGFVWDDEEQIVNNLVIRNWSNLPLAFTSSTFFIQEEQDCTEDSIVL